METLSALLALCAGNSPDMSMLIPSLAIPNFMRSVGQTLVLSEERSLVTTDHIISYEIPKSLFCAISAQIKYHVDNEIRQNVNSQSSYQLCDNINFENLACLTREWLNDKKFQHIPKNPTVYFFANKALFIDVFDFADLFIQSCWNSLAKSIMLQI